jgi:hypothetical protein
VGTNGGTKEIPPPPVVSDEDPAPDPAKRGDDTPGDLPVLTVD